MSDKPQSRLTVYYDGDCPVCSREISYYAGRTGDGVTYCDVAAQTCPAHDLSREDALRRLHARLPDGRLVSGAEAFVALWERVPGFGHVTPVLKLKPVLAMLDLAYAGFLKIRPLWR
jgi:ubiquinone biosynthesis monooxygenase Coq7